MPQPASLSALRRAVAALERPERAGAEGCFALGLPPLDAWLGGGLGRGVLHEVHAASWPDAAAAGGFALGLAARAAQTRPLVWIRQDYAGLETGQPYGEGLAAFGLDPRRLTIVRTRDPTGALRAAAEVARCPALGAALVEIWGEPKVLDLSAGRKLALAARASGTTLMLLRLQAEPAASVAASRWRVAASVSMPLEANAPGHPAFEAALIRHRAGLEPRTWRLEWDRDRAVFASLSERPSANPFGDRAAGPPLPRFVVPVPARGPAAYGQELARRRAG